MPGVGHTVCRCWTPNNTFCVPCHAGWLLQPSRKAEKLYMKAEMQIFRACRRTNKTKSWFFFQTFFSSILKYCKADLPRWLPIFCGFVRSCDTWSPGPKTFSLAGHRSTQTSNVAALLPLRELRSKVLQATSDSQMKWPSIRIVCWSLYTED